jgi:hypothetical protein
VFRENAANQELWTDAISAGSRLPFINPMRSVPDQFVRGGYRPYLFSMGYVASYAAQKYWQI